MRSLGALVVAGLAFVLVALPSVVLADGRVALVVGNGSYVHIGGLSNPENDAADMSAALLRLGFEVTTELDRVRLFFVGGRISLCGSEAGGNWIRHGVVREQRRGPVADGTCAVSDGWGCSAGTRALGGGSQYASMRRRPVAA